MTAQVAPHDFSAIRGRLGAGLLVDDRVFDAIYPHEVRRASSVHWTPVEVGMRAARLLAPGPGGVIVDIGAGVGKFCLVAACVTGARIRGVEHRRRFVDLAEDAATTLGVSIDVTHGTIDDLVPKDVDGIYLFNPFAENLCPPEDRLDATVEHSQERFWRDLGTTTCFLREARPGTRVVTYCGFGGTIPQGYSLALRERRGGPLELWVKD